MKQRTTPDWEHVIYIAEDHTEIDRGIRWAESRRDVRQALDAAYALGGIGAGIAIWRGYGAERSAQGSGT